MQEKLIKKKRNRSEKILEFRAIWLLLLLVLSSLHLLAQSETYYSEKLADLIGGETEYSVEGGRVDILSDEYAIEVKLAKDWKHTIGQALWYGMQTNRKPGIILIMKSLKDRKYGIQLQSALDYADLDNVKVWFYPEDFGGSLSTTNSVERSYLESNNLVQQAHNGCLYWINTGSSKKTRHNQSCRYYNNTTRGRCTNQKEGNACGKCGG